MGVKRGDLVTVALQGDHGKPRPALVIQSDHFPDTATTTVLLVTSKNVDAPLIRLSVEPSSENGLRASSQIMIDKTMTVRTDKLGKTFGQLDDTSMIEVNRALALFLGLAG
jgi:mRNA interferase MazF